MLRRLMIVLRVFAVIAILSVGGAVGCFVLSALAPTLVSAPPVVVGGMMGFAFAGGMVIAGTIIYVIFGERALPL